MRAPRGCPRSVRRQRDKALIEVQSAVGANVPYEGPGPAGDADLEVASPAAVVEVDVERPPGGDDIGAQEIVGPVPRRSRRANEDADCGLAGIVADGHPAVLAIARLLRLPNCMGRLRARGVAPRPEKILFRIDSNGCCSASTSVERAEAIVAARFRHEKTPRWVNGAASLPAKV